MTQVESFLRVRETSRPDYGSGEFRPGILNGGEQLAVLGLPLKSELVRLGVGWSIRTPLANAFAPVAAMPTTLANVVLHNAYETKALLIDTVWALSVTSIAAATSFTQLAQISNAGVAAPTDNSAVLISSRSGRSYSGAGVRKAIANSAFALADRWTALGCESGHPSTTIGAGVFSECWGGWIVPPGATFCVNLVASTAAGTMIQGIDWFEVDLDLP